MTPPLGPGASPAPGSQPGRPPESISLTSRGSAAPAAPNWQKSDNSRRRAARPPRRLRHGQKLRDQQSESSPKSWVAAQWLAALNHLAGNDTLLLGHEYARDGQIASLSILPGEARGEVQGRSVAPYAVRILFQPLSQEQWRAIVAAMSQEAIYPAKLLAGEIPDTASALFDALGLKLISNEPGQVQTRCTCGFQGVCKHATALGYLLVERIDDDPLKAFTLRGVPADRLLERLREARTALTGGASTTQSAGASGRFAGLNIAAPPLQESLEHFWRAGPELDLLSHRPPPQHVSHALLRRLGPSPLKGKFPMSGLLASIYDAVAEAAVHLRDRAEHIEPNEDQSDTTTA